ncbi:MAG: RidA family protein [Propionibacteriaceae bacterium]|jgi:enamine deaminase RidA (YjgF/YER057c/UK114 family)|nr:RidA family protein [Propionibacteriaceae bacterium]
MNEEVAEKLPSVRLAELGISLPSVPAPVASYIPAILSAGQVYTSGQLPSADGQLAVGKLGAELGVQEGAAAARTAALNALAACAEAVGGVDNLRRVVKAVVYVASAPGFTEQPKVANGASELLGQVFGPRGAHVRSAVGVAELPLGACVEVELVCEASAASF